MNPPTIHYFRPGTEPALNALLHSPVRVLDVRRDGDTTVVITEPVTDRHGSDIYVSAWPTSSAWPAR